MKTGFDNGVRVATTDPEEIFAMIEASGESQHDAAKDDCPGISDEHLAYIESVVARRLFEAQCDVVRKMCFLLKDARKPKRLLYQLMYACGMGAAIGGSATQIAEMFGISKQAFEQGADRALASLEMRKNGLGKSAEASAKYGQTNYRQKKSGPKIKEEK